MDPPKGTEVNPSAATGVGVDALPKYTYLGEQLRHSIPSETQCQLFCGGAKCKYEGASWDKNDMVIDGLFSHWATENILAMARPNTPMVIKHDMINQFQKANIKSIFNLQHAWEHAFCGPPLDQESGFSYSPTEMMRNEIYFYNFPWDDYGTVSMPRMLDTVKVLEFALTQGNAAVHCHAGLGRTGTFIACYLIYAKQFTAVDAIMLVRKNRPRSIQTRAQLDCIREFEEFLRPLRVVFGEVPFYETKPYHHTYSTTALSGKGGEDSPIVRQSFDGIAVMRTSSSSSSLKGLAGASNNAAEMPRIVVHREFTLSSYLRHQCSLLSGEEARRFRYIPRIIHVICSTLLHLAGVESDLLFVVERMRPAALNRRAFTASSSFGMGNAMARLSLTESILERSIDKPDPPNILTLPETFLEPIKGSPVVEQQPQNWEEEEDVSLMHIAAYLLVSELDPEEIKRVDEYKLKLNQGSAAYSELEKETNPVVLASLFWSWLDHLKEPVLTSQDLFLILNNKPAAGLLRLDKGTRSLLYYLLHFVSKLLPLPEEIEYNLILRLLSSLTYINLFSPFDDLQQDRVSLMSDTASIVNNTNSMTSGTTPETSLASAMYLSCPAHFNERRSKKDVAQLFAAFHQIITQNFPCHSSTDNTPMSNIASSADASPVTAHRQLPPDNGDNK